MDVGVNPVWKVVCPACSDKTCLFSFLPRHDHSTLSSTHEDRRAYRAPNKHTMVTTRKHEQMGEGGEVSKKGIRTGCGCMGEK